MIEETNRRSARWRRTEPPRLVHVTQRSVQRSVTLNVTQITILGAFRSALDLFAARATYAASRFKAAARRWRRTGRRSSRKGEATSAVLVARRFRVTSGRWCAVPEGSARSGRRDGVGPPAVAALDTAGSPRRAGVDGADRDGTVIAAIPPKWVPGQFPQGCCGVAAGLLRGCCGVSVPVRCPLRASSGRPGKACATRLSSGENRRRAVVGCATVAVVSSSSPAKRPWRVSSCRAQRARPRAR